jgi:hypothetical protein
MSFNDSFCTSLGKIHTTTTILVATRSKKIRLILEARAMSLKLVRAIRGTIVKLVEHNSLLQL